MSGIGKRWKCFSGNQLRSLCRVDLTVTGLTIHLLYFCISIHALWCIFMVVLLQYFIVPIDTLARTRRSSASLRKKIEGVIKQVLIIDCVSVHKIFWSLIKNWSVALAIVQHYMLLDSTFKSYSFIWHKSEIVRNQSIQKIYIFWKSS